MATATSTSIRRRLAGTVPTRVGPWLPLLGLAAWTLFVWGGRIRNVATDDQLTGWALAWRSGLAGLFVALALILLASAARQLWPPGSRSGAGDRDQRLPRSPIPGGTGRVAAGLAVLGTVVWLVRGVDIALGDHSTGFKVVHLVLAAVTIALSGLVLARRPLPPPAANLAGDG